MGELSEVLSRLLRYILYRVLGDYFDKTPFFQQYGSDIFWGLMGAGFLVVLFSELHHKQYKDFKEWRLQQTKYAKKQNAGQDSELPIDSRRKPSQYWTRLKDTFDGQRITAPIGLRVPLIISIGILVIATTVDVPYDFYVILRVVVFLTCIIVSSYIWKAHQMGAWFWIAASIALLYNPLLSIHLHKETWQALNVATIPVLVPFIALIRPTKATS